MMRKRSLSFIVREEGVGRGRGERGRGERGGEDSGSRSQSTYLEACFCSCKGMRGAKRCWAADDAAAAAAAAAWKATRKRREKF
jgi:hypothetical protein